MKLYIGRAGIDHLKYIINAYRILQEPKKENIAAEECYIPEKNIAGFDP